MSPRERADRHPLDIALAGVNVAQLAIAVLGVLVITRRVLDRDDPRDASPPCRSGCPCSGRRSASTRSSRFVLMLPAGADRASSRARRSSRRHDILQISFSHPGVARAVIGGALYLMLVGIFALAHRRDRPQHGGRDRDVRRRSSSCIPPLMNVLPTSWNNAISQYLPSDAGRQIFSLQHGAHTLRRSPAGWSSPATAPPRSSIAAVLLVRRDV